MLTAENDLRKPPAGESMIRVGRDDVPAAPLPGKLVDTVGAGDSWMGAFLAAVLDAADVAEAAKRNPDAVVIPGLPLVPPIPEFYADARVHPNDLGFTFYARNLIRELRAAGLPR